MSTNMSQKSHNLVASTLTEGQVLINNAASASWLTPSKVLMVTPDYFRIDYAINPYMKDSAGNLKVVNLELAQLQWLELKNKYLSLGTKVVTIPGRPTFPDMVFAANQSLVFQHEGKPQAFMSKMKSTQRQGEVKFFEEWYKGQNYAVSTFESGDIFFEGNGDALLDPEHRLLWGGVGPRTNVRAYHEIAERFHLPVITLPLQCEEFYHLDTCFAILDKNTVAVQPKAFNQQSLQLIHARFPRVIDIDFNENINSFAGNCHSPNGLDVVLQQGSSSFVDKLKSLNFKVHEVQTNEFIKSGGSVFCMKMMVF